MFNSIYKQLERRKANREKAEDELKQAKETGNEEEIEKLSKRTVHMDETHIVCLIVCEYYLIE